MLIFYYVFAFFVKTAGYFDENVMKRKKVYYVLNYRSEVPLSKSQVIIETSCVLYVTFMHSFLYFSKMIRFKGISSDTLSEKKTP